MKWMTVVNGMSSNALLVPLLMIAFGMYVVAMMCHGDAAVRGKIAESATAIVIAGIAVFSSAAHKTVGGDEGPGESGGSGGEEAGPSLRLRSGQALGQPQSARPQDDKISG